MPDAYEPSITLITPLSKSALTLNPIRTLSLLTLCLLTLFGCNGNPVTQTTTNIPAPSPTHIGPPPAEIPVETGKPSSTSPENLERIKKTLYSEAHDPPPLLEQKLITLGLHAAKESKNGDNTEHQPAPSDVHKHDCRVSPELTPMISPQTVPS